MERKVCFILDAITCGEWGGRCLSKAIAFSDKQRVRTFIDRGGGGEVVVWGVATCRNSIVSSNDHLQLVFSGLTSIILVVLGTINFQFQDALVPISLRSLLRIVAAQVLGTVWSSCSYLLHLVFWYL